LALRVRSLRKGGRLAVKTAGNDASVFTVDATCKGAAASSVRQTLPASAFPKAGGLT
jgi:hypothetical protein